MGISIPSQNLSELELLRARVAELEQAELEMRRSAELNRRIAESMPGGIVQIGLDGYIHSANPDAQRLLGLERDDVGRRNVQSFAGQTFYEDGSPCPVTDYPVSKCLRTRQPQPPMVIGVRLQTGQMAWMTCRAVPWHDPQTGEFAGAIVTFLDLTERKRAEQALHASEQRFRRLVDHATDAFFVHDLQGRIVDVNHWACVSLGYPREKLLERSLADLDPKLDASRIEELWQRLQTGVPITFEGTHRRQDGSTFPVEVHAGLFQQGDRPLILALARNATERKRIEDALRAARNELELRVQERTGALREANAVLKESEAKWRSLVQNAPDLIVMLSLGGTILFINRAPPSYSIDEVVGRSVLDFLPPDLRERARETFQAVCATGEPDTFEISFPDPPKPLQWYSCRMGPIKQDRKTTALIVIATDITLAKQAHEAAQQHQAELTHVARLSTIGEMAAELAHELNQPLAAISNYAGGCVRRLQADSGEPRELIAALEEITLQANRASEILKGIRNFARKREAQRALVDINAYVSAVASRAAFAARKHQVTIQFELNDALPLVAADGIQLEQVLLNLLLNGFEAMHDVDESRRQLHIRTAATAEQLIEVTVTDHGHGFPPEIAEDIFHPFFTTKPEGLGMGLSISRSIVEAHGGKLTAVLNHDHGATFRFTLPCPVAEQPVDECDT